MAEYLRKRIEELKLRKAAAEDGVVNVQSTKTTAAAITTTAEATVTSLPPQSSSTAASKSASSIAIANLPPSFVSPHAAVVKYRDTATDPLCTRFTTNHAVVLFESMLQQSCVGGRRRKRGRSSDAENTADEERAGQERQRGERGEDMQRLSSEGSVCEDVNKSESNPVVDCSLNAVISCFLPDLTAKCFSSNEGVVGKDESANKNICLSHPNRVSGNCNGTRNMSSKKGYIMMSGKRRLPCRSVNEYVPKARIAHGVYGVVFSATRSPYRATCGGQETDRPTQKYALKQVKKQWLVESQVGFPPYLLREFDLLLRLRHPNIVHAQEVVILDKKYEATRQLRSGGDPENSNGLSCDSNRENLRDVMGSALNSNAAAPNQEKASADGVQRHSRGTDHVKDVYLVMEYCPYDLKSFLTLHNDKGVYLHLSSRNTHPDARLNFLSRVKCIMQQLFQGLLFLHEHRILHRDIKTSNILISHEGIVKFCDFGLGRLYCEGQVLTGNVVTLMYRAPELHFGVRDYSHKMDVWSLGCIMAELFLKMPLFRAEEETKHFAAVCDVLGIPTEETFSGLYKMPELVRMMRSLTRYNRTNTLASVFERSRHAGASTLPATGLDLLRGIFRWNPIDRPSAREALDHPFFREEPLPCAPAELLRPLPTSESPLPAGGPPLAGDAPPASSSSSPSGAPPVAAAEEDDAERTLMRELQSLKDAPSSSGGEDEAQRVAIQARLRANQDRDCGSSPEY